MILEGRAVHFRLSPEGKLALKGLGFFEKETISAWVASVDELGAWIEPGSKKRVKAGEPSVLVLLKWDYFSTAVLDYKPEKPVEKRSVGFVKSKRG
jgi:hypothetical protein